MGCHFLMDRRRWTMAEMHHFDAWDREEREIFARMVPRVTGEGIDLAGAYYRVARHFPKDRRQALIGMIESVTPVEGAPERRFDGFVRSVSVFRLAILTPARQNWTPMRGGNIASRNTRHESVAFYNEIGFRVTEYTADEETGRLWAAWTHRSGLLWRAPASTKPAMRPPLSR